MKVQYLFKNDMKIDNKNKLFLTLVFLCIITQETMEVEPVEPLSGIRWIPFESVVIDVMDCVCCRMQFTSIQYTVYSIQYTDSLMHCVHVLTPPQNCFIEQCCDIWSRKGKWREKEFLSELNLQTSCGAGIAKRVSALDRLSLHCAAIITLHVRTPACSPKQGTLPHLLYLWTEM